MAVLIEINRRSGKWVTFNGASRSKSEVTETLLPERLQAHVPAMSANRRLLQLSFSRYFPSLPPIIAGGYQHVSR